MKKLVGIIGRIFRRPLWRTGAGIRGRVHKISIIAGGEVSVVLRFRGLDEPRAKLLVQGTLVEIFETRDGSPPPLQHEGEPLRTWNAPASERADPGVLRSPEFVSQSLTGLYDANGGDSPAPCTCGTIGGHPHEPDCPWWKWRERQTRYDQILNQVLDGKPMPALDSPAAMDLHQATMYRLESEDAAKKVQP